MQAFHAGQPLFRRGLTLGVLLAVLAAPAVYAQSSDDVVARVIRVQGAASLGNGTEVQRGTGLAEGSSIHTGEKSRVRIRFIGGSLMTLGGESALEVVRYQPETDSVAQQARFRLLDGVMLAVAEGITPDDSEYTIETTAGSIGIRGTILWGGYFLPGQADYILFRDGPVDVANERGQVTLDTPGQGTTVAVDDENRALAAPSDPVSWAPGKVFNAVTTIAFD